MHDQVPVHEQTADERGLAQVIAELRRWHIFRIAAGYAVATWIVVQVVATIGPAFGLPVWVLRAVVLAAIVGFLATMGFLLFRPRSAGKGKVPTYLSGRARLIAATAALLFAAASATFLIRSLSAREQVSLAVLPFADLSPARDKAYLAEGVAEEILSALAVEKNIKVLGRTSARQIELSPSPKEVQTLLGVTHLLEGSTRTAGNNLRVNVRLIDTSDGSRLWEEEYNGALSDVFSVQDRIAEAVLSRLRSTLFNASVVRDAPVTKIDAYQAYLAARTLMRDRTKPSLTRSLQLARQVIQSDPKFAPGHALYAELLWHLSDDSLSYGEIPAERVRELARPHALKAIELAPNNADGYAALGLITGGEKALTPLKRAIELDPARAELRVWLGIALSQIGQYDEAYEQSRLAAEVEPLWAASINRVVLIDAASRRFNEALTAVEQFERRGGDKAQALRFRSGIARRRGDHARASSYAEAALARNPALPYIPMSLAGDYRLLGLTRLAAAAVPKNNETLRRLLIIGEREAVYGQARTLGASLWKRPDADVGIFALSAARDWSGLAALYRARRLSALAFCQEYRRIAIPFVLALQRTGGSDDARALAACLSAQSTRTFTQTSRSGDFAGDDDFDRARLLALTGDRKGAVTWLERAIRFGWLGYDMAAFSPDLADWPEFDSLRTDGRLPVLQQQINATISAQRAKVLSRYANKSVSTKLLAATPGQQLRHADARQNIFSSHAGHLANVRFPPTPDKGSSSPTSPQTS